MSPEAPRVLVIDDNDDLLELYRLLLEDEGYEIHTATSGDVGYERACALRPDLIILDVVMPGMNGLDLLAKLRREMAPPVPPVILCSGFDLSEQEAVEQGALMFLRKPVAADELKAIVARGLAGSPLAADLRARHSKRASAARERSRSAAVKLLQNIQAKASAAAQRAFDEICQQLVTSIARYFGCGGAAVLLMGAEHLEIRAAFGIPKRLASLPVAQWLPQGDEILETGSPLLIPDVESHRYLSTLLSEDVAGVRFFVGVPLVSDETAVGVMCVLDLHPRAFPAEDLAILQRIGRKGSALLRLLAQGAPATEFPGRFGPAVCARDLFELIAEGEASLLHQEGGSLELAVIELTELGPLRDVVADHPRHERLAAGILGATHFALLKRDSADGAAREVRELLRQVAARTAVLAVGAVGLAGAALPTLNGHDLLHLAELAYEEALATGREGTRIALQVEPQTLQGKGR